MTDNKNNQVDSDNKDIQANKDSQDIQVNKNDKSTNQVKVELKWKTNNLKLIGKFLAGLYLIGSAIGLNELTMVKIAPMLQKVSTSSLMTVELVNWADFIIGPVRFMSNLTLWYAPILTIMFLMYKLVSQLKFANEKELQIFKAMIAITLIIIIK